MGTQELEAALRRDGESKVRKIWQSVEGEAGQLRNEAAQRLNRQRQADSVRRQSEIERLSNAKLAAANKQAQKNRLLAESALDQRLKTLAEGLLEGLAVTGGAKLFQALAAEIPTHCWQQIKVHRRDELSARDTFPSAEIMISNRISAGLEVQSEDGRVQIINTLEKRLEHLWPEVLPELLKELRQMAGDDGTVA